MLKSFTTKLEIKLFKKYKLQMDEMLVKMANELEKLVLLADTPPEVPEIVAQIRLAVNENDQTQYLKYISSINQNFNNINSKYLFDRAEINSYFYLCQRALNWMTTLAYSHEGVKFLNVAMNPRGLSDEVQSAKVEGSKASGSPFFYLEKVLDGVVKGTQGLVFDTLPAVGEHTIAKSADLIAKEMTQSTIADVLTSLNTTLPSDLEKISVSEKPQSQNPLENLLGKKDYANLQSSFPITDIGNANDYATEQIYGQMFEMLFSQIAMLEENRQKVIALHEDIADKTKRNQKVQEMMHELGLKSLLDPKTQKIFNEISVQLGFKDSNELYKVYQNIKSNRSEGYNTLINRKKGFVHRSKDTNALDNPYDAIVKILNKQYGKIVVKLNDKAFCDGNSTYVSFMSFLGSDFLWGLDLAFQIKSVGKGVLEGYLQPNRENMLGYAVGRIIDMGLGVANSRYVDSVMLSSYHAESEKILPFLASYNETVNLRWMQHNEAHIMNSIEMRSKQFGQQFDEQVTAQLLKTQWYESISAVKTEEKEKPSARKRKQENLSIIKDFYFSQLRLQSSRLDFDDIQQAIDGYSINIQRNLQSVKESRAKISNIECEIEKLIGKEQSTWNPFVYVQRARSLLGFKQIVKRPREVKINKLIKAKNEELNKIKQHQINNTIYYQSRSIAKSLLAEKQMLRSVSPQELIEYFSGNIASQKQACQNVVDFCANVDKQSTDLNALYDYQNAMFAALNKTGVTLLAMMDRIDEFTLDEMETLSTSFADLAVLVERSNKKVFSLGNQYVVFCQDLQNATERLNQKIAAEKELAEKEMLEQLQSKIQGRFLEMPFSDIHDPYEFFKERNKEVFNELSAGGQKNCISFINRAITDRVQSEQSLETYQLVALYQQVLVQAAAAKREPEKTPFHDGYSELKVVLDNKIREKYRKMPLDTLTPFIHDTLMQFNQATKDAQYLSVVQSSWLYNPLGSITVNDVIVANDNVEAYKTQLALSLSSYRDHMSNKLKAEGIGAAETPDQTNSLATLYEALIETLRQPDSFLSPNLTDEMEAVIDQLRTLVESNAPHEQKSKFMFFGYASTEKALNPLGGLDKLSEYIDKMNGNKADTNSANEAIAILSTFATECDESALPDYERGWIQLLIDKDGQHLQNCRNLYLYAESLLKNLTEKVNHYEPNVTEEVLEDGDMIAIIQSNNQSLHKLDKMFDTMLPYFKDNIDNQNRFDNSVRKWNDEIEKLRAENAKALALLSPSAMKVKVQ